MEQPVTDTSVQTFFLMLKVALNTNPLIRGEKI